MSSEIAVDWIMKTQGLLDGASSVSKSGHLVRDTCDINITDYLIRRYWPTFSIEWSIIEDEGRRRMISWRQSHPGLCYDRISKKIQRQTTFYVNVEKYGGGKPWTRYISLHVWRERGRASRWMIMTHGEAGLKLPVGNSKLCRVRYRRSSLYPMRCDLRLLSLYQLVRRGVSCSFSVRQWKAFTCHLLQIPLPGSSSPPSTNITSAAF